MATPLVGSRLLNALNGFINMLFIARLGANALAASALIFTVTSSLCLIMWTVLYSMAVIIGRAYGAGNKEEIGQILKAGMLLSLLLGLLFSLLFWHIDKVLLLLHQPRDLVILASPYFHVFSFGVIPNLFCVCFAEFVIGIMRARLVIIWALFSTPCNILLGYGLLFGKFGLPKLGLYGAAFASSLTYWVLFLLLALYFCYNSKYKEFNLWNSKKVMAHCTTSIRYYFRKILTVGWPISLQLGAIALSYSFLTCMVGWIGTTALTAHNITNQWTTLIIMVPYGIAQASGVLVAQALGKKQQRIMNVGLAGVLLGCVIVIMASFMYWFAPNLLISAYLNSHDLVNNQIVYLTILLMAVMGVIQFTDSIGVILTGALRGFHDTTIPMLICIIMNWVLSIPLGYFFGFVIKMGAVGLYLGFALGSICGAVLLSCRFRFLCNKHNNTISAAF